MLIPRETAQWVCKAMHSVFALEGSPRVMVTDNAEVFRSEELQNFLKMWRVVHRLTPRYSPWYGGFSESTHKCLVKTLAGLLLDTGSDDWKRTLSVATYMYNCRPYDHSVDSGLNPQEVFRGRKIDSIWKNGALYIHECLRLTDDVEGTIYPNKYRKTGKKSFPIGSTRRPHGAIKHRRQKTGYPFTFLRGRKRHYSV